MTVIAKLRTPQRSPVRVITLPGIRATTPTKALAGLIMATFVLWAIVPSWFVSGDPLAIHPLLALHGPSAQHIFGTDEFGRDMFAQIIYGTRTSLLIGITSVALGGTAGTIVGVIAGWRAGLADAVIMRMVDVMLCFPGILLALVFQAALGPGLRNEVIAVAVASVPTYARVARGQALSLRSRPYVDAARSAGVREVTIVRRHIVPPVLAPIVALATISVGTAVVLAAALSFLGLGSQNGHPDWGRLIGGGQQYLATAWWISTFPGLMITLVVLCAGVLGDALQRRLAGRNA